jgi:succinate dehydrogenase / fumarate reductase flavoprotein subunit
MAAAWARAVSASSKITDENPYKTPMRIYPAVHYTMGGLWVDYNLQSNLPGLFVLGEANFSDHGANRLGASALMQGLADGYFVIPYTLGHYIATAKPELADTSASEFKAVEKEVTANLDKLLAVDGKQTVDSFHKRLGKVMWDHCGMARNKQGLEKALELIPELRQEFWSDVRVLGGKETFNQSLEKAGRVADFLEFGEVMVRDALTRDESAGGHFREEHQTKEGEALCDDDNFAHAAVWEYKGVDKEPVRHKEEMTFECVKLATRSYK